MAAPASNAYAPRRSAASPASSGSADQVIGKFKRLEHIGKGSFAEVYRGIHIVRHVHVRSPSWDERRSPPRLSEGIHANALSREQEKRASVAIKSVNMNKLNKKLKD